MSTEDAFLSAIEANLGDSLVRGVYADFLDEHNRPDEAAAWRATADRVPDKVDDTLPFVWWSGVGVGDTSLLPEDVFDQLTAEVDDLSSPGRLYQVDPHKHYPTARAALLDLVAAWVRVNCGEKVCERCKGAKLVQVYTRDGDYLVEDCWDCAGKAVPVS